jgi:hypothetical protein
VGFNPRGTGIESVGLKDPLRGLFYEYQGYFILFYFSFIFILIFFQFCDVAKVAIIHKMI